MTRDPVNTNPNGSSFVDIEGELYSSLWSDLYQSLDIFLNQVKEVIDNLLRSLIHQSQKMRTPGMEIIVNMFHELQIRVFPGLKDRLLDILNEGTMLPETPRRGGNDSPVAAGFKARRDEVGYLTKDFRLPKINHNGVDVPFFGYIRRRFDELWEVVVTVSTELSNDSSDVVRGLNPNFGDILDLINDVTAGRYDYSNIDQLKQRMREIWKEFIPPLNYVISQIQSGARKSRPANRAG